jgi:hypothetical protein
MACDSRSKKPLRDILRLCECSFIQNFQIPVPATGERDSQILYSHIYKTDLTKQTCEFCSTVRRLLGLFPFVDFSRGGWPQKGTIVHHLEQCAMCMHLSSHAVAFSSERSLGELFHGPSAR